MYAKSTPMSAPSLFVHRFTVLDFARLSERGFEGESVYVNAELEGDLDERGFLMDFGPVKKMLKRVVDGVLDHRFALPADYPSEVASSGQRVRVKIPGELDYAAPEEAFAMVPGGVDDDSICAYLSVQSMLQLPSNVSAVTFELEHEAQLDGRPSYRYTHGLKKHDGNCQRLIHGHRNIVEVFLDGERSVSGERRLAEFFRDVHFAHIDDVQGGVVGERSSDRSLLRIEYVASQGQFFGELPADRVLPLACEPTVENIAVFAREWIARELGVGLDRVAVRAYEGLHKGARCGQRVR